MIHIIIACFFLKLSYGNKRQICYHNHLSLVSITLYIGFVLYRTLIIFDIEIDGMTENQFTLISCL